MSVADKTVAPLLFAKRTRVPTAAVSQYAGTGTELDIKTLPGPSIAGQYAGTDTELDVKIPVVGSIGEQYGGTDTELDLKAGPGV